MIDMFKKIGLAKSTLLILLFSIFVIVSLIVIIRGILGYDMQGSFTNTLLCTQLFFGIASIVYLVIVLKEL